MRAWLLLAALALGAGALVWALRSQPGTPPDLLPADTAPAGTPLPDGLVVPQGAVLLGPVLVIGPSEEPAGDWIAVMALTGNPLAAWDDLIGGLAGMGPDVRLNNRSGPGCRVDRDGFDCEVTITGRDPGSDASLAVGARLGSRAGDVTGRYLIVVERVRLERPPPGPGPSGPAAWTGGDPPRPRAARRAPGAGGRGDAGPVHPRLPG